MGIRLPRGDDLAVSHWQDAAQGLLQERNDELVPRIKSRQGQLIAIVTKGDTVVKGLADHIIEVPETLEAFTPLLTTIPLQLLSYHIAVMRNCNVDQPRNLAKSVTVE